MPCYAFVCSAAQGVLQVVRKYGRPEQEKLLFLSALIGEAAFWLQEASVAKLPLAVLEPLRISIRIAESFLKEMNEQHAASKRRSPSVASIKWFFNGNCAKCEGIIQSLQDRMNHVLDVWRFCEIGVGKVHSGTGVSKVHSGSGVSQVHRVPSQCHTNFLEATGGSNAKAHCTYGARLGENVLPNAPISL
mmetsp:Transcript_89765/g.262414  ORF Transcript_89765/g.262414 Transcript_89765/m.262414 type:complete len:190 (+) Transcript_89765:77-646(+)